MSQPQAGDVSSLFPFSPWLKVAPDFQVHFRDVLEAVYPLLTADRRARMDQVVTGRTGTVIPVLENLYDRGNISAVLRSAEAFGLYQVHNIELGEKFKESQRTTAGADKWVEMKKWKSTRDCVEHFHTHGYQVVATHLSSDAKPIQEIDFTQPTALVLGNEKEGITPEMAQLADHRVILPMYGFVQSFNISVAGAMAFYQVVQDRMRRQGRHGDLSQEQMEILKAVYSLRTLDSAADILFRLRDDKKLRQEQ